MVVKGILEQITTANVNLVNADLLAKERGLRVVETKVPAGEFFFLKKRKKKNERKKKNAKRKKQLSLHLLHSSKNKQKHPTTTAGGDAPLTEMTVTLATSSTRFSAALNAAGKISVAGAVRAAGAGDEAGGLAPFLTRVGAFDVDLALEGIVLLTRQTDQPGIIAAVSAVLGEAVRTRLLFF